MTAFDEMPACPLDRRDGLVEFRAELHPEMRGIALSLRAPVERDDRTGGETHEHERASNAELLDSPERVSVETSRALGVGDVKMNVVDPHIRTLRGSQ